MENFDSLNPNPHPTGGEEQRLRSLTLNEAGQDGGVEESSNVEHLKLPERNGSLPADFYESDHTEIEIEIAKEELGEGSVSPPAVVAEAEDNDTEVAAPDSPSSSGYAGERGSSSGIEEADTDGGGSSSRGGGFVDAWDREKSNLDEEPCYTSSCIYMPSSCLLNKTSCWSYIARRR